MTKPLLVLASLITLAASHPAHADRGCQRRGALLVSEVHKYGMDVGPSGIELYASGAWHIYHHDPKAMDQLDASGCITDKELAELKDALAKAPWKITHSEVTCDAIGYGSTEWSDGKHKFSQELCGHDSIDSATEKAFAIVQKLEQAYTPKR